MRVFSNCTFLDNSRLYPSKIDLHATRKKLQNKKNYSTLSKYYTQQEAVFFKTVALRPSENGCAPCGKGRHQGGIGVAAKVAGKTLRAVWERAPKQVAPGGIRGGVGGCR